MCTCVCACVCVNVSTSFESKASHPWLHFKSQVLRLDPRPVRSEAVKVGVSVIHVFTEQTSAPHYAQGSKTVRSARLQQLTVLEGEGDAWG